MVARICRLVLPLLILVVALGAYRLTLVAPDVPTLRDSQNQPQVIAPGHDWPEVVTDEQMVAVLKRMRPPGGPANTNDLVHAFRLWGPQAQFGVDAVPDGDLMRQYLLDDRVFRELAGEDTPPLYELTSDGDVLVRTWENSSNNKTTSSYHANDILATLAETGTSLDTPLVTRDGSTDVRALLETALQQFHLDQHEYEWSIISYARYVYPQTRWKNQFGERIVLSQLIDELLDHPLPAGPCNGLHRMEAIAVLNRADENLRAAGGNGAKRDGGMRDRDRKRLHARMQQVSSLLASAQSPEGYWTRRWPEGEAARDDLVASLSDRILVTGHHLEWMALAPSEALPPRETIVRAAQWLIRAILEVDDEQLRNGYGPFSHAARALCLWRKQEPYQVWVASGEEP